MLAAFFRYWRKIMRYYISDCHFGHGNLNDRMDKRGFSSTEEMNEYMISQWNKKIKNPNHEIVILGDFSLARAKETMEILKRLRGKKILIQGNHEKYLKDPEFNRNLFKEIYPSYHEFNDNKRKIVVSHYPIMCYNGQNRVFPDGSPATYMLYGHVHNTMDEDLVREFVRITKEHKRLINGEERSIPCEMINCFCMKSDYMPLTLDEWIELEKANKKAG